MAVSSRRQSAAFRRGFIALALASTCVLVIASSAQAATVTVGSPLTGSFTKTSFCIPVCILANTKLTEAGTQVTAPVNGTITRWRMIDAEKSAFQLRVLQPDGTGNYILAGTSAPGTAVGLGVESFSTSLPVKVGDLVGLENLSTAGELGVAATTGSALTAWFGSFSEGANTSSATETIPLENVESGFNAEIEYTPPPPPAPTAQPVPAPAPVVAHCTVPKLTGKNLKAAKKSLAKADCKLGKVKKKKGVTAKTGKVSSQRPGPGKVLAPGAKVSVKLGG